MSVSTKGFISIPPNQNVFEQLNRAVCAIVRSSDGHQFPFRLTRTEIGNHQSFFLIFNNKRTIQIGYYEDTESIVPVGPKITFSLGCYGDAEYIIKECLKLACKALKVNSFYFQENDFNEEFQGPITV